jgi:hydroxymethylpyrimidine pyrophosphatase-like HAD family hydrolase
MNFNKFFIFLTLGIQILFAEPLDKQKILEIIQAAKKNKSIRIEAKIENPIIVYKRRTPKYLTKKKRIFVPLPSIPPSSVALRIQHMKKKKTLFTTANQKNKNSIKTVATPIKYY